MNLMKSFNRNYMIQNLKKSKSVLAFFLGVLPIVSMLFFLVLANVGGYSYINLESISVIHYLGIYFIPIILSVCLFGFVYKKKSVDFTCSMPLSRKTIFTTNTITGILLLLLIVSLSGLSIYIISILTGIIIPFKMIVDYILIWGITYIFVFVLSNIAMCISGNTITQIVVTMLLLFFIPFVVDYIKNCDFIIYGVPQYQSLCIENISSASGINEVCDMLDNTNGTNYTLPYNNIRAILGDGTGIYNMISLIKMSIISIFGIVIGKILFVRRKMENNQTSFKDLRVHNFVKALTMVPIVAVISAMVPEENVTLLLVSCIFIFLLVYFIIYDFITKKSFTYIKKSLVHFIAILLVLFPASIMFSNCFDGYRASDSIVNIQAKDITSIRFSFNTTGFSLFEYVDVKDQKSIDFIINKLTETTTSSSEATTYKQLVIKTNENSYKITTQFNEESYQEIVEYVKKTDDFKNTKTLLDNKKAYVIGFEETYIKDYTTDSKVIEEAKNVIENDYSCKINYMNNVLSVYAYDNGNVYSYQIDSCKSDILSDYVEDVVNRENKDFLDRIKNLSYTNASNKGISYGVDSYSIITYKIGFKELNEGLRLNTKEVYSFMKKYSDDKVDVTKEYVAISGYLGDNKYIYYTNRVEELLEVLEVEKEDLNDIN